MAVVADLTKAPVVHTSSVLERVASGSRVTSTLQCLVVSGNELRREMLAKSAAEAGWETVTCGDAPHAWAVVQRERFELALVDLAGLATRESGFRELTEHVISSQKTLLVICGNEGNPSEEIWARQLGAWLYLPGVSQSSDIQTLCEEARPVAEKLMSGRALV